MIGFAQQNLDAAGVPTNTTNITNTLPEMSPVGSIPLTVVDSFPFYSGIMDIAYDGEFLWACGAHWFTIYKINL